MATTNTLRLKVGGKYKTRDGRVAEVDEVRTSGTYCVHGTVDGCVHCWTIDGTWYVGVKESLDLVSEIQDEAPAYRYFRWADEARRKTQDMMWRVSVDGSSECINRSDPGDAWAGALSDLDSLLGSSSTCECDADGNPLEPATPEPASARDLTPEQRTRIAKLAARIVLANGPVLTVDELAGLTVAELVAKLEPITPAIEL